MGKGKKVIAYYYENFKRLGVPIPWRYYTYILTREYGFEMSSGSGAQVAFTRGEIRFIAHRPHGRDMIVDMTSRKNAIREISKLEASDEGSA